MKQLEKAESFWTDGHAYKYGHHGELLFGR